jgi:phosphatidylserine decarboxylase
MRITNYGKDVVLKVLFVTLILDAAAYLIDIAIVKIILFVISLVIFLLTLYFFRDPDREPPENISDDTVLSPADGKVVLIEDIENIYRELFPSEQVLKKISIFLSPLNVHVNRIPLSGKINYFRYLKGTFLVAFEPKASDKNERTEIGVENKNGKKIVFKQIAGYVARRIVCKLRKGDEVVRGDRFGMIKFGSRMDIIFKPDSKIFVTKGQKVICGKTIITEIT